MVTLLGLCALSALIVRLMIGAGRIDEPGPRSSHTSPTPKGGGVGILAAFVTGLVLLGASHGASLALAGLLAASCGLALVAFLDDLKDWPFWTKLAAQSAASCLVIACGITLTALPLPVLGFTRLGLLGAPLAFCWLLFATNATNFIDGLNGLAAGVTLVACLFLAGTEWGSSGLLGVGAACSLAAGAAGFLPYNFPRASIFMGDVGSQLCGFVLASLGLLAAAPSSGLRAPWMVPMLLSGILYDVALTLVRRLVKGDRLTQAHRDHLYQVATRAGVPPSAVAIVHWAMAAWGGACALLLSDHIRLAGPLSLGLLATPQILWTAWVLGRTSGLTRPTPLDRP